MSTTITKIRLLIFLAALVTGLAGGSLSQVPPHTPRPPAKKTPPVTAPPAIAPETTPFPVAAPAPFPGEGGDYEKSIDVDSKVSISMCISSGSVRINGTQGNEVRVFVRGGSNIGFNIREKSTDGKPVWIAVVGADAGKGKGKKPSPASECLWGNEIEIDVPVNSAVTVKGQAATTSIDAVRKAFVRNVGGNISISNVAEGVDALTYEGAVSVRESRGAMNLESSTGNIIAFDIDPGEIGDVLRAKTTSGKIFLQMVGHRQIDANSVTGSLTYTGKFLSGGVYSFSTSNGALLLTVPADSSAKVSASYGFGEFNCDLPMKDLQQSASGRIKSLTATMGGGDAVLKLTTTSGAIKIRKSTDK